jgi:NAD-dependent DNA ligase
VGEDPGSKLDEARALGIEILDEAAFKKLVS